MNAMNNEHVTLSLGPASGQRPIVVRGPADMAELLPYFLGFYPDDSIVAVGLQGPDLHQGGVIRADLPVSPAEWPAAAEETAALLVALSERHGGRPLQVLLYLCQDPATAHTPPPMERLRPLADDLRAAFGRRGVAVKESLCVSNDRWWSFLCRRQGCCDPAGNPVRRGPDPGPAAAAATVAGLVPRGSRKAIVGALSPIGPPDDEPQREALVRTEPLAGGVSREKGLELLEQAFAEFAAGARELDEERTARLLFALRDRLVRDRGVEYVRPDELAPAERLWRFLARRAVPPYDGCAVAPLTLLAWASWVAGDMATARVVLGHVLRLSPDYLLAELLYESMNDGMTPGALLAAVEAQRRRREDRAATAPSGPEPESEPEPGPGLGPGGEAGRPGSGQAPGGGRRRRRGGRRRGGTTAVVPADRGPGDPGNPSGPSVPGEPGPQRSGPGPVSLLPASGCGPVTGARPARGVRLGRAGACASAAFRSGTGLHRCRTGRQAARGARRAH
ncbi:DUF4192 domain-containing protein [Kitasatospora sp. NPDC101157]|uniref:DUF4192 domain-containing protein n=1 Tax=Kitasatospora sp. NPDC101157 TaxID=3364098 RepID=UPI00380C75FF